MHFGEGDEEGKLLLVDIKSEEGTAADDLEARKDHAANVDMGYEDVAGDLADVVEEAQVQVVVLDPRQLQVPVHVAAVHVPLPQVPVVVVPVGWH